MDFLQTYIFHWVPEKALFFGGRTLLWDARCSGIYVGFALGLLWHSLRKQRPVCLPAPRFLLLTGLLFIPFALDVVSLILTLRPPSNELRFITGLLFGAGFCVYLCPAVFSLFLTENNISAFSTCLLFLVFILISVISSLLVFSSNPIIFWIYNPLSIFGFISMVGLLVISLSSVTLRTLIPTSSRKKLKRRLG